MGIRISLIKSGIGLERFMRSRNPVIRAHAYLEKRRIFDVDYKRLSNNLLSDCIIGGKLYPKTARIYQRHFKRFRLQSYEKERVSGFLMQAVEENNDPGFAAEVLDLMLMLDLPF